MFLIFFRRQEFVNLCEWPLPGIHSHHLKGVQGACICRFHHTGSRGRSGSPLASGSKSVRIAVVPAHHASPVPRACARHSAIVRRTVPNQCALEGSCRRQRPDRRVIHSSLDCFDAWLLIVLVFVFVFVNESLTVVHRFFHTRSDCPAPSRRLQLSLFRIPTDRAPGFCSGLRCEK